MNPVFRGWKRSRKLGDAMPFYLPRRISTSNTRASMKPALPVWMAVLLPVFLTSDEILRMMEDSGVYIIAIFFILLATGYGFMFLKRAVRYLKMVESRYLDASVLDALELSMKIIWGLLVAFICLGLLGQAWDWFNVNVWSPLAHIPGTGMGYIAPAMFCVIVAVLIGITVKLLHHNIQYKAGLLKEKPKSTWNPRVALVVELFAKYFLIGTGVVLIVTIGLTAIGFYSYIVGGSVEWFAHNRNGLIFISFVLILGYFFVKVSEAFIEDMKRKEMKFSPQILTVIKVAVRYLILIIVGIIVLFSLLQMFALAETGMILVLVFIVLIGVIGAVAAASNLRNAFSGIILMAFRPFQEGDHVRILDGIACEVVSIGIIFTRVRTHRGEVIDIPNNEVLSRPIFNYSGSEHYAISIVVVVPENADPENVKQIMSSAALRTEHILQDKPPDIFNIGLENDRVILEMQAFTGAHRHLRHIRSELMKNLSADLKEKGVCCSVHLVDRDASEALRSFRGQEPRRPS